MRPMTIQTTRGAVSIWSGPVRGGHLVFAIRGAFAASDQLLELADLLPEADVAVADLPTTGAISIAAFADTFREVLAPIRRPLTLVGASVGGLVALALSDLGDVVALDPPLSPGRLWPLHEIVARKSRAGDLTAASQDWFRRILGCGVPQSDLDYRPLLDGLRRRAVVLAGARPLDPPRSLQSIPSLLSAEDLDILRRHPMVDLRFSPRSDHDIMGRDPSAVVHAIRMTFPEASAP